MSFINNLFRKEKKQAEIQASSTVFRSTDDLTINDGDYNNRLNTIIRGYFNKLQYGNSGIQNVINYRRSWIAGEVTVSCSQKEKFLVDELHKEFKKNLTYIKIATFFELEGKSLIVLNHKYKDGVFKIVPKVLPFYKYSYSAEYNAFDEIISLEYTQNNAIHKLNLNKTILINSNVADYDIKNTPPNISFIVDDIINVDKAIAEWRTINNRFAKTTPVFKVEEWQDAKLISQIINGKAEASDTELSQSGKRWKVGEGIAIKGDVKALEFSTNGIESLKDEIINLSQKISGHTGIPIYLLGFPELMSNRATATEMVEAIKNKTRIEKEIISEGIAEIFRKAILIYNDITGASLNPNTIKVNIPVVSQSEINSLIQYFEPLYASRVISKKTFREILPNVDPSLEEKRETEEAENMNQLNNNSIDSILENMNREDNTNESN